LGQGRSIRKQRRTKAKEVGKNTSQTVILGQDGPNQAGSILDHRGGGCSVRKRKSGSYREGRKGFAVKTKKRRGRVKREGGRP